MQDNTKEVNATPTVDLNEILKVRREKLAELQSSGMDPFHITKYDRTHNSKEVKDGFEELEGKSVTVTATSATLACVTGRA